MTWCTTMDMEWELNKAAQVLVNKLLSVRSKESVLIYADTATNRRVVESTAAAVHAAGGEACIFWFETRPEVAIEPPRPLAAAMKASDVVLEFATKYLIHTKAWEDAVVAGARSITLSGMTPDMMIRVIGRVDPVKMRELGDTLVELTSASNKIEIISPALN